MTSIGNSSFIGMNRMQMSLHRLKDLVRIEHLITQFVVKSYNYLIRWLFFWCATHCYFKIERIRAGPLHIKGSRKSCRHGKLCGTKTEKSRKWSTSARRDRGREERTRRERRKEEEKEGEADDEDARIILIFKVTQTNNVGRCESVNQFSTAGFIFLGVVDEEISIKLSNQNGSKIS